MGFIARHRQNHEKLEHVKRRAAELLPLCEQATGVKLDKPLKLEISKPWLHKLRYFYEAFKVRFKSHESDGPGAIVFDPISSFKFMFLIRKWLCVGYGHDNLFGYFHPSLGVVGFNPKNYFPDSIDSDYTLAHELTHLLLSQHRKFNSAVACGPQGSDLILNEGAATFYGAVVARLINPIYDVTTHQAFTGPYEKGYNFFSAVASALGDPISIISAYPPVHCFVDYSLHGERMDRLDAEVQHVGMYIQRVNELQAAGITTTVGPVSAISTYSTRFQVMVYGTI